MSDEITANSCVVHRHGIPRQPFNQSKAAVTTLAAFVG
jgi:hypothetical protein